MQPVAGVYWPDLSPTIMKAESDTLVILDCCCAGLATVTSQNPGAVGDNMATVSNFRKELIGACGWFVDTYSDMSDALRSSLDRGLPNSSRTISTHTLVRLTNNRLVQLFNTRARGAEPPQAVHYLLQRNNKNKMVLPRFDIDRDRTQGRIPAGGAAPVGNNTNGDNGRDHGPGYQSYRSREYLPFGVAGEDGGNLHVDVDHGEYPDAHDHSMLPDADEVNEHDMEITSPRVNRRISPAREYRRGIDAMQADHECAPSAFVEAMMVACSGTTRTTATQTTTCTATARNDVPVVQAPGHDDGFDVCDGVSLLYDPEKDFNASYYKLFDDEDIMSARQNYHGARGDDGGGRRATGGLTVPQSPNQDIATQLSRQQQVPAHLGSSLDKYPDHPRKSPSP